MIKVIAFFLLFCLAQQAYGSSCTGYSYAGVDACKHVLDNCPVQGISGGSAHHFYYSYGYLYDSFGTSYICHYSLGQSIAFYRTQKEHDIKYYIISTTYFGIIQYRYKQIELGEHDMCKLKCIHYDHSVCTEWQQDHCSSITVSAADGPTSWEHFCPVKYTKGQKYLHSPEIHNKNRDVIYLYQMFDQDKDCKRPGISKWLSPVYGTTDLLQQYDSETAWGKALVRAGIDDQIYENVFDHLADATIVSLPTFNSFIVADPKPYVVPLCYKGDSDPKCKLPKDNITTCNKSESKAQCFARIGSDFFRPKVQIYLPQSGQTHTMTYYFPEDAEYHYQHDQYNLMIEDNSANHINYYLGREFSGSGDNVQDNVCIYYDDFVSSVKQNMGCAERPKPEDSDIIITTQSHDNNHIEISFARNVGNTITKVEPSITMQEAFAQDSSSESSDDTLYGVSFIAIIPDFEDYHDSKITKSAAGYNQIITPTFWPSCIYSWKLVDPKNNITPSFVYLPSPAVTRDTSMCCSVTNPTIDDVQNRKCFIFPDTENCKSDKKAALAMCPGVYSGGYTKANGFAHNAKICAVINTGWKVGQVHKDQLCTELKITE